MLCNAHRRGCAFTSSRRSSFKLTDLPAINSLLASLIAASSSAVGGSSGSLPIRCFAVRVLASRMEYPAACCSSQFLGTKRPGRLIQPAPCLGIDQRRERLAHPGVIGVEPGDLLGGEQARLDQAAIDRGERERLEGVERLLR